MSPPSNGFDLEKLSIDELRSVETAAQERIRSLEAERREAAFQALEELARRNGLTKAEVVTRFGGRRSRKPKNRVKYRNPENPSETWTGVGRTPKWVEEHFAQGGALEDLAQAR